ncbi:ERG2/sigma1 receptor-like protein [Microdochium trichocladiopsis]|uniref:C-8 sterol isomerase n=1 Tax=Microdochium trichocladiopsis TaxID=1682393 RepID=A0A9P8Y7V6_9PEZI|nr:ERG2/sigma1 receptor-like protein [Microdochium trichocladiopsis]KAH7032794.1 ERG2/sigma1 receptor-like protein [Microdochium trichocladiopsis]
MAPNKKSGGAKKASGCCNCSFTKILTWIGIFIGIFTPIVYVLERNLESFYIFKTGELHDLAKRAVALYPDDTAAIVKHIVDELAEKHPKHVNPAHDVSAEWMFNNAGGAMGGMYLLHASITEYLIIFGTPIGTEGHTGRHTADDFFHILTGTQYAYAPGSYKPEIYKAGDVHHLRRGTVKQYMMPETGCFALEYARGWIPPMLFFGFADGLSSTLDFPTLWQTTRITGREMIGNLLRGKL